MGVSAIVAVGSGGGGGSVAAALVLWFFVLGVVTAMLAAVSAAVTAAAAAVNRLPLAFAPESIRWTLSHVSKHASLCTNSLDFALSFLLASLTSDFV